MSQPIRVITEPSVFVLGRQSVDLDEMERALQHIGAPDWTTDAESAAETLVEFAGRVCYDSFNNPRPGGNAAYISRIRREGHGSVMEHGVWTLLITGVSRSLTHELVRHRVGLSPSQLSQRFVDESNCAFVVPPAYDLMQVASVITKSHERYNESCFARGDYAAAKDMPQVEGELSARWHRWLRHLEDARTAYADQVDCLMRFHPDFAGIEDKTARRKRAREAARSVLPNCVETRIVLTGNARAWRHLIEMRGSEHADAEFRRLALVLLEVFRQEAPNLFGDYSIELDGDGRPIGVTTPHRKV